MLSFNERHGSGRRQLRKDLETDKQEEQEKKPPGRIGGLLSFFSKLIPPCYQRFSAPFADIMPEN